MFPVEPALFIILLRKKKLIVVEDWCCGVGSDNWQLYHYRC